MKLDVDTSSTLAALDQVVKAKSKAVNRALKVSAMELVDRIKDKVSKNQTRGRAYRRGGVVRYASRPGSPPNKDTGWLAQSTQVSRRRTNSSVFVIVGAKYARSLEWGRRRMAARPFVRPSVEESKRRIRVRVTKALNNA